MSLRNRMKASTQRLTQTEQIPELGGEILVVSLSEREWHNMQRWFLDEEGNSRPERALYGKALLIGLTARDAATGMPAFPELFETDALRESNAAVVQAVLDEIVDLPERIVRQLNDAAWRLNIPDTPKNSPSHASTP